MARILFSNLYVRNLFICNACSRRLSSKLVEQLPKYLRYRLCVPKNISFGPKRLTTKQVQIKAFKLPPIQRTELQRLFSIAKPEKWTLLSAVALLFVSSAVSMSIPYALGKVIDIIYTADGVTIRENSETQALLNRLALSLLAVFVVGALCNFGRVYLMNISGQRITKTLRGTVFRSILRQEIAFFDRTKTGELVNRLSSDVGIVSKSVTMNISDGLRAGIMVSAGVSMMFYLSWELALIGLTVVPPLAAVAIVYGRFVRTITRSVQDSLASATDTAEERIACIKTVRAFSQESKEIDRYITKIDHVLALARKEAFARGVFYGMTGLAGNSMILSVLYFGGMMVSNETITVGSLSAFLLYAAYIGVSINGMSSFYAEMNRGLGASTRLWELIDRVPLVPVSGGIIPEDKLIGHLAFHNVRFSYSTRPDVTILKGLNLNIAPASVTAVVGSSGSGKSTLTALLLRFYDPDSGIVTLDGRPITELDPNWIRQQISTVSQEPILFSGTIRENILYGTQHPDLVTQEQLEAVAKEAYCYDFITQMPQGFDTLVGVRGTLLSGGQKQRVALARALIKDPRILILDEATSALDSESEHLVQESLEKIMKSRTVLTIAHRLSTIKTADNIIVLEGGKLVEQGSYQELVKMDGAFKNLIKHQTQ